MLSIAPFVCSIPSNRWGYDIGGIPQAGVPLFLFLILIKEKDMKASNSLIEKMKEFEGYKSKAYRCPAGVWTCGHGHTKGVKSTTTCTRTAAEEWLRQDIAPIERYLSNTEGIDTQYKFDACVDFCFNLGMGAFSKSTLRKKIMAHAPEREIRAEFMKWVNGGGRKLPGLVRRREWEADWFFRK